MTTFRVSTPRKKTLHKMRRVFSIIAFLSLLVLSQSLRIFTSSVREQKSQRSLTLFQSQTSLDTFIKKDFEARWRASEKRLPDLNSIIAQTIDFKNLSRYREEGEFHELVSLLDKLSINDKVDVKLVCGDKSSKPLLAHRLLLETRSRVFEQYLSDHNATDEGFTVIELPDVDREVGRELLHFMYCRAFSADELVLFKKDRMGEKLLRAALKYQITELVDFFDSVLAEQVNRYNAAALLLLANRFLLFRLRFNCNKYLLDDIDLVWKEFKTYAPEGIAGDEDKGQNYEGQPAKSTAALKENVNGDVDEGEREEEDVTNEVDCDYGSDE